MILHERPISYVAYGLTPDQCLVLAKIILTGETLRLGASTDSTFSKEHAAHDSHFATGSAETPVCDTVEPSHSGSVQIVAKFNRLFEVLSSRSVPWEQPPR
jgi:hypothetical protein